MSSYADRLAALREQLKADQLDGFVVPLTDEHMSEYVGSYAQRLAWLTGFEGSAGSAVVLPEEAAIFTDGRYTLQVRQQVSADHWSYQSVLETSIADWLKDHAPDGARIGYDPWLHSRDWVIRASEALKAKGAALVAVKRNPIDAVWTDRPEASKERLIVHPDRLAGKSSAEKRHEIADWLVKQGADAAVLAALDSIAWTFNVRGKDVSRTPVALAYALVLADGTADLYVAGEKLDADVAKHLGNGVRVHERAISSPPNGARASASSSIPSGPSPPSSTRSTRQAPPSSRHATRRCCRAPEEPGRDRRPPGRPGARRRRHRPLPALGRAGGAQGGLDELKASDRLEALRREAAELRDLSFDTIRAPVPTARLSIIARRQPRIGRWPSTLSTWSIWAASMRTAPPTSPGPSSSASRRRRCATGSRGC